MAPPSAGQLTATGPGEVVDVALDEAVFSLLDGILPECGHSGVVRERQGNALPGSAPSNSYRTVDGRYITIGANGESIFGVGEHAAAILGGELGLTGDDLAALAAAGVIGLAPEQTR